MLVRWDAGSFEGLVKGNARPDEEGHQPGFPKMRDAGFIPHPAALPINGVLRQIGAQIGTRCEAARLRITRVRDLKNGTRARVALTIDEEVIGQRLAHDNQIALHKARREAMGRPNVPAFANRKARLQRRR